MVLQKDTEVTMEGTCDQLVRFKGNGNKKVVIITIRMRRLKFLRRIRTEGLENFALTRYVEVNKGKSKLIVGQGMGEMVRGQI